MWYYALSQQYRFDHDGVQVAGIVTGHITRGEKDKTYYLKYQYRDSHARIHSGVDQVSHSQWMTIHDQTPITVVYLRDDEDFSILLVSIQYKILIWPSGISAILYVGVAVVLLFVNYRQSVKRTKLLHSGMCIERIALAKRIQLCKLARLIYEYASDDGQIMVGYDSLSREERRRWEAKLKVQDNAIPILFNRMRPSEHTITDLRDRLV
jgi:hypothetical protein